MRGIGGCNAGERARAARRLRGRLAWGLLASLAAAAPAAAEVGAGDAPPFHSSEGGFSARFPEAPRYAEKRESTLLGVLHSRSWAVERGALRLRVERHDLPALATLALGDEALLERAARGLLADAAARAPRSERVRLREHPGRHLRYEPGDRPGEVEDAWLYLLGHRLYVIFARGGPPALRFAASVEISEQQSR